MEQSQPPQPSPSPIQQFFASIYTMYYRKDTNHLQNKNFIINGNLRDARERAQRHCDIIGARLNFVQPFISNLDKEEDFHLGRPVEKNTMEDKDKEIVK